MTDPVANSVKKYAAVSGTSSGIGKAIAQKYLDSGYGVWGIDVQEPSVSHRAYSHLTLDIRDFAPEHIPSGMRPEIIVAAAGTLEEADAIEVNLNATIRFVSAVVSASGDALRSVLFIASASARNGAEFPMYVASKAGIVGYMKNLALKLSKRGVTCNSISPGGVITPANRHILEDPELYRRVLSETLTGKWAAPEEIAELAYFLTVQNRSIIGEDILIDNGEMLRSNFIW